MSRVAPLPAPGATGPFKVVLINPYELGRQPFALAEPAAWLKRAGFAVSCLDLSLQKLDPEILEDARLVALYVGMHTATRIALAPTFVAFIPWTTLGGYIALLERLVELQLVQSVPPVQLSIRLLVPYGSWLLKLPGFREKLMAFDPGLLGYPWIHPDTRVDRLHNNSSPFDTADP